MNGGQGTVSVLSTCSFSHFATFIISCSLLTPNDDSTVSTYVPPAEVSYTSSLTFFYRRIPSEEALSSVLILLVGHPHNWQLCIYNLSVDLAMSETHDPQRSPGEHAQRKVSASLSFICERCWANSSVRVLWSLTYVHQQQ